MKQKVSEFKFKLTPEQWEQICDLELREELLEIVGSHPDSEYITNWLISKGITQTTKEN